MFDKILLQYFDTLKQTPGFSSDISGSEELVAIKQFATSLIYKTLDDPSQLEEVSKRSYVHDNGFVKIVFRPESGIFAEVRLHLWSPPSIPELHERSGHPSNIHDHSADFVSVLLKGKMQETIFSATRSEGSCSLPAGSRSKYWCGSRGEMDSYGMKYIGETELWACDPRELNTGSVHGMMASVFHQVIVHDRPAITLFVQGPRRAIGTTVFGVHEKIDVGTVTSPYLTPTAVSNLLRWAKSELDS